MPVIECANCGVEFRAAKWDAERGRKYCSRKCFGEHKRKRVIVHCRYCDKSFEIIRSCIGKQVYCSKKCRLADGWIQSDPEKRAMFTCEWCGKEFEEWAYRTPRFCSHQCTSEYAARQPKPSSRRPKNYVTLVCEHCGQEFTVHQCIVDDPDRNPRFCSAECRDAVNAEHMTGEGNPNWAGGITVYDYGPNWQRQRRRAVRRDRHRCRLCEYASGGDRILDVHHIVNFSEFGGDWGRANRLPNLITLCRNCHFDVHNGKQNLSPD